MKKLAVLFAAMLILVGCGGGGGESSAASGSGDTTAAAGGSSDAYVFQSGDVTIAMNAKAAPIVEALGEYDDYFESESCAFDGLDKQYTYGSFILKTYPLEDVDYVSSVEIRDDLASTPEGVSIGSPAEDVVEAYGEPAEEGTYSYTKGDCTLLFLVQDGAVTSIQYTAITE